MKTWNTPSMEELNIQETASINRDYTAMNPYFNKGGKPGNNHTTKHKGWCPARYGEACTCGADNGTDPSDEDLRS